MNRELILREMGLGPVWRLRAPAPAASERVPEVPVVEAGDIRNPGQPAGEAPSPDCRSGLAREAAVPSEQTFAGKPAPTENATPTLAIAPTPTPAGPASMDWEALVSTIADCRQCALGSTRKQAVPGVGDRQADWLFVGEGPGAEEDERGEPFVGQAGKLLDNMLAAIGLQRGKDVYIANAVKCRPPNNRTPEASETAACFPYLERQIELIQPRLIIALGRPAAHTLLQTEVKIAEARGRLHRYREIPLIVTYHPAYLLRSLADKALAWEDLLFMRETMNQLKEA